jgi:hypothetical protein
MDEVISKYPWSSDLPEKLTFPQLAKKLSALYRTLMFITAFTKVLPLLRVLSAA